MDTVRCEFCGKPMDKPAIERGYQKVTSWTRRRSGGGEHGLTNPEYLKVFAHAACVEMAKLGHTGQGGLF
jgi:organic hydroperoxide reductase OsmC/OhrA